MKIALLGANGQVGHQLVKKLITNSHYDIWGPTTKELDLCDIPLIYDIVCAQHPDIIINTAAYTNVDGAEKNKELADKINHQAVRQLAKTAKNLDIPLIHFSTDYVFDGKKQEKYTEQDSTHPLSVYGRTKLDGDEAVLTVNPKGIIFRTSWIYSWRRTNFFLKMKALMQPGATIHVVNDQIGIPNSAELLATKVYEYVQTANFQNVNIVNLVCSEQASWFDFAQKICICLRKTPWVKIIPLSTEQYLGKFAKDKTIAMRPKQVILDNSKALKLGLCLPTWDVDFANFIKRPCV